jgi:kelch-like protein 10
VVERYDPEAESWEASPSLPVPRAAPGVVGFGGRLYVAGGEVSSGTDDWDVTDSMIIYDPERRTWQPVVPMPTARTRLRLVAAGDYLYAIGGFSNRPRALPVVERYDPKRDTWEQVALMNQPRGLPGAVAISFGQTHFIVVVGGGLGELFTPTFRISDSMEIYNVAADNWQMLRARLPRGRVSLICALEEGGSVLAIGGATGDPTPLRPTALVEALTLQAG